MEKIDPYIVKGTLAAVCSDKCENNTTDDDIPEYCNLAERVGKDHCVPWYLNRIKELETALEEQEREYQRQSFARGNVAMHQIESAEREVYKLKTIIEDCIDCSIKLDACDRPAFFRTPTDEEMQELEGMSRKEILDMFRRGVPDTEELIETKKMRKVEVSDE